MKDVTDSTEEKKDTKKRSMRCLYIPALIGLAIYYYIALPAIHYAAREFWFFLFIITVIVVIIELISDGYGAATKLKDQNSVEVSFDKDNNPFKSNKYKFIIIFWALVLVIGGGAYLILSPIFFANNYANMITVETKDFAEDFPETDLSQIPLVDRDTAERLGDRQLGALTELVSQFEAAPDYTQINIDGAPYRGEQFP